MKNVLILCTGNSCRSQMAEALWNRLGDSRWQAVSAGSNPAGYVHPMAIESMREIGADLNDAHSQHVNEFEDREFDLVVTVCDNAREACPAFPRTVQTLHWPFDDPAHAVGTDEEKMDMFRRVRGEIAATIQDYLKDQTT